MSTTTQRKKPRPIQIDWPAINRAMTARSRNDFNRLHSRIDTLADDLAYRLCWDAEADDKASQELAEKARKLKRLICEIPWMHGK